jgi:hypothetical protein
MAAETYATVDFGQRSALVVAALRTVGRHTLDKLPTAAGLSWAQVFMVVDELSRRGRVRLRRVGSDYEISLNEGS